MSKADRANDGKWRPEMRAIRRAVTRLPAENLNLALHLLQRLETYRGPGSSRNRRDPTAAELAARGDAIPDEYLPGQ